VFALCLFTVIFWISYHYSVKAIVKTATGYQEKMLVELNGRLQEKLDFVESISLSVSRNSDVINLLGNTNEAYEQHALTERVSSALLGLTFSSPMIDSIHVYMNTPPASVFPVEYVPLQELYNETWYPLLEKNDFLWVGEHSIRSPNGTKSVVSFARKLTSLSGDFAGVVLIHIKATTLQAMLGDNNLLSQRLVVDSTGRKIVQIGNPSIVLTDDEYKKMVGSAPTFTTQEMMSAEKLVFSSSTALVVSSKMAGSGWVVAEITPWKLLAEDSLFMLEVLGMIGLLSIIAVLLISIYLNRQFTKPIYLLLKSMNRYPDLDMEQLPKDYRNEFGQLFLGYNRLLTRIEELYQSLEEQYKRKKETEVKALQAMMNPHFLYNTLDQLNWMAIKDGNSRMSVVLEMTGAMLRIGLSDGEALITVEQELDFVKNYMQIQQIRLGEKKITYRVDVSGELLPLFIPKMTLQPFVENSIKHGFHGREHGNLDIQVRTTEAKLIITITDDGKGLHNTKQIGKKTAGGYGIGNVRARLNEFFDSDYSIELIALEREGTQVTIQIPRLETKL
jgi:two-component system sensor histidine kinase YesM